MDKFIKSGRWINGPDFLWKKEDEWPTIPDSVHDHLAEDTEVKHMKVNAVLADESLESIDKLFSYFSSWYHLKRAVSWILRVKNFLLHKIKQKKQRPSQPESQQQNQKQDKNKANSDNEAKRDKLKDGEFTARPQSADLRDAEKVIIQYAQRKAFGEEVKVLERKVPENDRAKKGRQDSHYVMSRSQVACTD